MTFFPYDPAMLSTAFQGKYGQAEPLYERSQTIREKVLGPEHPAVAAVLNSRAGLFRKYPSTLCYCHLERTPFLVARSRYRASTTRRNRCTVELSLSERKCWAQSIQIWPCGSITGRGCWRAR